VRINAAACCHAQLTHRQPAPETRHRSPSRSHSSTSPLHRSSRGFSKFRTHTGLGFYSRASPRSPTWSPQLGRHNFVPESWRNFPLQELWTTGYLAHKELPPPQDHRRAIGIGLLHGPRRRRFLMSEVPLYPLNGEGSYSTLHRS
jgi:hypothetical protein